jgi:hypothetical protein
MIDRCELKTGQNKQEELMNRLKQEGHTCVCVCESYPVQVEWCHQTPCKNALQVKEEYWIGPYDIKVPISVNSVPAEDGGNMLYQTGRRTEMNITTELSEIDYKAKYAVSNENDGCYYWKC